MSCIDAGLVDGRNFAVDASLIEADAALSDKPERACEGCWS